MSSSRSFLILFLLLIICRVYLMQLRKINVDASKRREYAILVAVAGDVG